MCWINISDQMPSENEIVDLYSENGGRLTDCFHQGGTWYRMQKDGTTTYLAAVGTFFTHWRYPPAPPAEYVNAAKG